MRRIELDLIASIPFYFKHCNLQSIIHSIPPFSDSF